MLLIVVVYRLPRSNDIVQFILQQQDGGDRFLERLNQQHELGLQRIELGVWRMDR
jgi:hypothetical protein